MKLELKTIIFVTFAFASFNSYATGGGHQVDPNIAPPKPLHRLLIDKLFSPLSSPLKATDKNKG